jgi:hypothetical protein
MSERRVRAPSVADGSWPSEADRRQLLDALRSVIAAAGDFQFNLEPLPPRLLLCPGSECLELAVGRAYRLVGLDEPDPAHPSEGAGPAGVLGLVDRVARAWCVERGVALDTPIERDDPHLLAAATVIGLGVAGVNAAAELGRAREAGARAWLLGAQAVVQDVPLRTASTASELAPDAAAVFRQVIRELRADASQLRRRVGAERPDADDERGTEMPRGVSFDRCGPGTPDERIQVEAIEDEYAYLGARPCRCGGTWQLVRQELYRIDGKTVVDRLAVRCDICGVELAVLFQLDVRAKRYRGTLVNQAMRLVEDEEPAPDEIVARARVRCACGARAEVERQCAGPGGTLHIATSCPACGSVCVECVRGS